MGYTIPQLQLMLAQNQAGQSVGASGWSGSSSSSGKASSGSYGGSNDRTGKGYIDDTFNAGGTGTYGTSQSYTQLKRGMGEWIAMGQPEKAMELFLANVGKLNIGNSTGKKQYNELAGILNREGYGIPLEK